MSKDTIYWIFSTLPQVLAALAGLVMAGLAIYDQNLKREIDRDSSIKDIINPFQRRLFRQSMAFFLIAVLAIVFDVVVLRYAEVVQAFYEGSLKNIPEDRLEWEKWKGILGGCGAVNLLALILLFPILYTVLKPDLREKIKGRVTKKTNEELGNEVGKTPSSSGKDEKDSTAVRTVSPEVFGEYYREFEKIVGDYFPDNMRFGRLEDMSGLVKRLFDSGTIPHEFKQLEILNIVKLHNLQLHGADIGPQNERIIHILKKLTHVLREKYPAYMVATLGDRGKLWKRWIDENVEGFDEAHNLDQAIRYHHRYGEYDVFFNGHHVVVTPPDGSRLVLPHNAVQEFLRYLEARFSPSDLSLEEEKSFRDALGDENDDEDK